MEELKSNGCSEYNIIYVNFEYIEYEELQDYKKLNTYIKDKITDDSKYYIFLDEIQKVNKFEEVINSLRASLNNISIFITGTNSKLLSQELSSVLSGRYVLFNIYPLSYKEFIALTGKKKDDLETFFNYIKWGGLPNRCQFESETNIKDYLHSVFDSIILRDVVDRLGLKDTILFDLLLQYVVDTTGAFFSAKDLLLYLNKKNKKVSTETIYIYLDALCKALIINKIYRYDIHGKSVLKTLNKYYMTDLGIAQIKNNNFEINKGFAIDNVVYNELKSRGYDVYIGKTKNGEIDFIGTKDNVKKYFQVAYSLKDESVLEREFNAFKDIKDDYSKYVLSLDKNDFSKDGIIHKNIIEWLLEND